ncbi:MAG TPA: hypothetical protein VGC72_09830 [Candidatus Elarobacter sp.]|jgi:hypothetical protein
MKQAVSRAVIAALTVASVLGAGSGARAGVVVPTQHNDNLRTGANLAEMILTPAAVSARGMRRVDRAVDGVINTQILYAPGVSVGGKLRNVAYVTTSANSVYAFDADDGTKGPQHGLLWRTPLADASASPPAFARGINATPVLEFAGGKGTIDVLYSTADTFPTFSIFVKDELALRKVLHVRYYLVKLDLATGQPVFPAVELHGSMLRDDKKTMTFDATVENDTASLLLDHGYLYASFSARQNENVAEYYGWLLRYKAADLSYAGAFNTQPHSWDWKSATHPSPVPIPSTSPQITCYQPSGGRLEPWENGFVPNGGANAMACVGEGGGIWQGGAGPAADRAGNVYVMIGNGHYDPREGSYGDSVVRLYSRPGGGTTAADFGVDGSWAPPNEQAADEQYDVDLGSAGPMIVEGNGPKRVIVGGKTGIFYVVGGAAFAPATAPVAPAVQYVVAGINWRAPDLSGDLRYRTWNQGPHLHGSPTLWRVSDRKAYVYEWAEKDFLKKYEFDLRAGKFKVADPIWHAWVAQETGVLAAPCVQKLLCLNAMPGGMLAISARGTDENSGIVWAILRGYDTKHDDSIYAFDAKTLHLIWSDSIGSVPHFAGPTVADGHVFVPTNSMQWRFTIYSLGDRAVANGAGARLRTAPPDAVAKLTMARAMPMKIASPSSKIPDYAADPAYRARLQLPRLVKMLPPGTIVGAAYGIYGNEVYDCSNPAACTRTRTDVARVFPYDDRPGTVPHSEIPLGAACSYAAVPDHLALSADFPEWQLIRNPCPVFGQASLVARTWSIFTGPAVTQPPLKTVPFFAIYLGLQPGAR